METTETFDQDFTLGDDRIVITGQFLLDGAQTIDDAIWLVEGYADHLRYLKANGFELESVIDNNQGLARIVR